MHEKQKKRRGRKKIKYVPSNIERRTYSQLERGVYTFLKLYGNFFGFYSQKKVKTLFAVHVYMMSHISCTISMINELCGDKLISTESWVLAGKKLFEVARDTDDCGILRISLGEIGRGIMDVFQRDHPEFFLPEYDKQNARAGKGLI